MADARTKAVHKHLVDNYSRRAHLFDAITDLGQEVGDGDVIDIPAQVAPTNRSATTRAAPESLSPSVTTMTVDQEVFYNIALPKRDIRQLLAGKWPEATAIAALNHNKNEMDLNLINHLYSRAWSTTGAYHTNVADGELLDDDIEEAIAGMCTQEGCFRDNLMLIASPYMDGSLRLGAPTWNPGFVGDSANGGFMVERLDKVAGVPVLVSNSIQRNRTVATTAVVVASNVATATVAEGHNLVPGMFITTSGHTVNATTAVAITSVTTTTIVYPLTTGDATLADGVGTITARTSENLLIDRTCVFGARQALPGLRIVPDFESRMDGLQIYSGFARAAILGRVRVLHSRGSSV